MPLYEYLCRKCGTKFELLRPMSRGDEPAACPSGHADAQRLLSLFAAFSSGEGGRATAMGGSSACGGCAGGHCAGCSHH